MRLLQRRRRRRRGQGMTELIILVAAVLISLSWTVKATRDGMKKHYRQNRNPIASPM
jgi:hypothetical protein